MSATTLSRRRTKAFADQQAAKERRQKFFVAGAVLVLVVVLAFELPGMMSHGGSSSTTAVTAAAPAPVTAAPAAPAANPAALRAALKHPARDPFAATTKAGPNTLGSVPYPAGLHDPFASRSTPASATTPPPAPVAPVAKVSQIQGKIVIGTPGKGRVAEKGWIVILASIPTSRGRHAATAFMSSARGKGVTNLSLLNSSNRRPLRGGYWVVYTGPFASLGAVSNASSGVHGKGYSGAYVRELVVYKPKAK